MFVPPNGAAGGVSTLLAIAFPLSVAVYVADVEGTVTHPDPRE